MQRKTIVVVDPTHDRGTAPRLILDNFDFLKRHRFLKAMKLELDRTKSIDQCIVQFKDDENGADQGLPRLSYCLAHADTTEFRLCSLIESNMCLLTTLEKAKECKVPYQGIDAPRRMLSTVEETLRYAAHPNVVKQRNDALFNGIASMKGGVALIGIGHMLPILERLVKEMGSAKVKENFIFVIPESQPRHHEAKFSFRPDLHSIIMYDKGKITDSFDYLPFADHVVILRKPTAASAETKDTPDQTMNRQFLELILREHKMEAPDKIETQSVALSERRQRIVRLANQYCEAANRPRPSPCSFFWNGVQLAGAATGFATLAAWAPRAMGTLAALAGTIFCINKTCRKSRGPAP